MDKGNIYKITNKINNKSYIGCTINKIEKRFEEHIYRCFKTDINTKLYNSIRKYGIENFTIELLEICDINVIYNKEREYIVKFNTYENGLNSTFGGEGCLGYVHSNEIRKKISRALKNGNSHKGKTYDELYGKNKEEEKEKRRVSVKKYWESLTDEEKNERSKKIKETLRKKSKYPIEVIKEIKNKITSGSKVKELMVQYPKVKSSFFYELKNGRRWSDI